MKRCARCRIEKPAKAFGKRNGKLKHLLRSYCHECEAEKKTLFMQQLRARVAEILGDKCVRCGFSDPRALQIDHVNGGGSRKRGPYNRVRELNKVLREPHEYQLLCANCNWIKRAENKEYGNQWRSLELLVTE